MFGGTCPEGNFIMGNCPGGNCQGGECPGTVKNRCIDESEGSISDVIEIAKIKVDTEKAFHSLDNILLISTLENYHFGKNFIFWLKILLRDQESCVINGGTTLKYFSLGRGVCKGDPVELFCLYYC